MGLIGHEIVQTREWIDPNKPSIPNLNYKLTYPITVFDAVRRSMDDENSETLTQVLESIKSEILSRQPILPSKPPSYIVTYGGAPGAVGSIQISKSIPWDPEKQSNIKIPTEKAVGELIRKLGIDPDNPDQNPSVRWSDIIGRPNIYSTFGYDDNGIINQPTITRAFNELNSKVEDGIESININVNDILVKVNTHLQNFNNPHKVTLEQLGGLQKEIFEQHVTTENPHNITKQTLGLDRVDNTSDLEKPISTATKKEIDYLKDIIEHMTDDVGELNFITDITYDPATGKFVLRYRNGKTVEIDSPLETGIKDIRYDIETKELVCIDHSNIEYRIDLSDLYIRYNGLDSNNIQVTIQGDQITGTQIIKAEIIPKSIKSTDISDNAVTSRTIKDEAITSIKIRDKAITNAKIADQSITNEKIKRFDLINDNYADRSVDGRVLFTSDTGRRALIVVNPNSSPIWGLIAGDMITDGAIESKHLKNDSVTHDKLAPNSVSSSNISDQAIITDKIADSAVTTEKIKNYSIATDKLQESIELLGTPTLRNRPSVESNSNEIVDSAWVKQYTHDNMTIGTDNIADRSVTGDKLFTSNTKNRILAVIKANQNPVWTTINNEMMEENSIGTKNIIDKSITNDKLADKSVSQRNISKDSIIEYHITESAVTSEKIYPSFEANRVLAALTENGHPTYSQVTNEMMASNSIDTMQIKDGSVTLSKIKPSPDSQMVMTTGLSNSIPEWSKVQRAMIADRAVNGEKLFSADKDHMILSVTYKGFNPIWSKIYTDLIEDGAITSPKIPDKAIGNSHLQDDSVDDRVIKSHSITSEHIKQDSIDPSSIKSSPHANRVLAVAGLPYSTPMWLQVNTGMIEDKAVTREKIFQSKYGYRVLGTTKPGVPPEYVRINSDFIVDYSIIPEKLRKDFTLLGTPKLTVHPPLNANDTKLASTHWVHATVESMVEEAVTNIQFDELIPDHSIPGKKLFTSPYGPRVLGITEPNGEAEYLLVEGSMIAKGAVTTDHIQRDVHLLGMPEIEIRPVPSASDADGNGHKIPDCQWVRDRINEYIESGEPGGGGGTNPPIIGIGSIGTTHLQDRAVTGDKLFTSSLDNRVLAVQTANTSAKWIKVTGSMIDMHTIKPENVEPSPSPSKVLVTDKFGNTKWSDILSEMIGMGQIDNINIKDESITEGKIRKHTITEQSLADRPIIRSEHLRPDSVTEEKLAAGSVSNEKIKAEAVEDHHIALHTIKGKRLDENIRLPKMTTVDANRDYEIRSVRNSVISPNTPRGCKSGDIWFQFA